MAVVFSCEKAVAFEIENSFYLISMTYVRLEVQEVFFILSCSYISKNTIMSTMEATWRKNAKES